jgi:YbbR domain-containing protein
MMSVRLRGQGWVIAALFISPDVRYFINLASVGRDPVTITGQEVHDHVTLPVDVQVVDVKPDTLRIALDDYYEKRVPVVPRIVLNFREGYGQVGPVRVEPDSMTIGGTLEYIAGISSWNTAFKRYTEVRVPIDEEIPLEELPSYGVTVPGKMVRIVVNVEPFAEKLFPGIPLGVTDVPAGREVIFIPPRFDLIVRGGIDQLSKLSAENFSATVSFMELEMSSTGFIVPALSVPEGVKAVDRKPARFQFIIRKRL